MKKIYLLLLTVVLFASCRKDSSEFTDGPKSGSGGDTYQPVTKGSYWKYTVDFGGGAVAGTQTMTGKTAVFGGKTFYEQSSQYEGAPAPEIGHFYSGAHIYSQRGLADGNILELEYLHDDLAVGGKWQGQVTADNKVNGAPAKLLGEIKEKGISKSVRGKTYTNVIHSYLQLQYDYGIGNGFEDSAIYDFYVAKGVGIISIDSKIVFFGQTLLETKTELIEYSIK